MKVDLQDTSFFKIDAEKLKWISIIESKKVESNDEEFQSQCDQWIQIIKDGVHFYYDEVIDVLGIRNDIIPIDISIEVEFIMSMFEHITDSLAKLSPANLKYIKNSYYTNFTGFDEEDFEHLSHYVSLVKTKRAVIFIKNQLHTFSIEEYRTMLENYEKYRREKYLSIEMMEDILPAQHVQMNFLI